MNQELSLQDIKIVAFTILKHFKEFCQENDISFYLSNGTLLGAVKYGGFIPWDDDIDVLMPRKDYDKFVKTYIDSDKYKLFTSDRNSKYKFTYAKLCDMTTLKEETNIDSGVSLGIDIDIFPLDSCSKHILSSNVQSRLAIYQRGCILSKYISSKGKPIHKRIVIAGCKLIGFDFFNKRLAKIVNKQMVADGEYMGSLMWPIYGKKEIIPSEAFSDTICVEFEGEMFPAPKGYHIYLSSLYGIYENDPPIEKQKTHHSYKAYRVL